MPKTIFSFDNNNNQMKGGEKFSDSGEERAGLFDKDLRCAGR
jgi:hypothetical protein